MAMKLFLFDYFHRLGPDPIKNIDIIVETTAKDLHSPVALYNRLEDDILKTWSIYNEPEGFKREDNPNGHICYDMTIRKRGADNLSPVVLEKLEGSKWEELDANIKNALLEVKILSGLLPICASCKKIRDDKDYWNQIEAYIRDHSEAEFSHSICPNCVKKLYPDFDIEKES